MLKIDNSNNITLTRGDALTLTIVMKKGGQTYTPVEGDSLRFAMSRGYVTETRYKLILEKAIPIATQQLSLSPQETLIMNDTYNYDIEITYADGKVDTFISAKFEIVGECE